MVMVPLSIDSQRGVYGRNAPNTNLVFRMLRPKDSEIKRVNIEAPNYQLRIQNR